MTDHNDKQPLQAGLQGAINAPEIVAAELRLMAAGEDQYHSLTDTSPWIKNIWNAAADIIEGLHNRQLH